ncbi:MAG: efflux RND transporter periplasmic adaptor subunit [Planctomycetaceae bacterium]|nr:efflux RND transporter periplasmic adaptor subunit [Planctomycetaceae bacterium]
MLVWRRLALGALAALTCGCGQHAPTDAKVGPNGQAELPLVKAAVLRVEALPWPAIVKTQGSLIADEVTVVGAKVAGRVAEVRVDLGDVVTAQAPLATLDQEEFKLEISLAEAQLAQARAALGLAPASPVESLKPENSPPVREARAVWDEVVTRIERLRPLAARNAVTKDELEQAIADEGVASAKYSAAVNGVREKLALIGVRTAELSVAQQRLADTTIKAPFDGQVQQKHVGPGSYLQVGDPVATLVRTSTLRFRGTIPERHAHRLALGQEITLRFESAAPPQSARVSRISPGVDEMNRSLVFEALVNNDDGSLRAGLFAEAEVIVDPAAEALVVPQSAIVEFAGVEKVWKLAEGVAREQPVRTSRRVDKSVEIVAGLAAGDTILVDASQGRVARIDPIAAESDATLHAGASDGSQESGVGGQESGVGDRESGSSTVDATSSASRSAE